MYLAFHQLMAGLQIATADSSVAPSSKDFGGSGKLAICMSNLLISAPSAKPLEDGARVTHVDQKLTGP